MAPPKTHEEEWELESGTWRLGVRLDKEVGGGRPAVPQPQGREGRGLREGRGRAAVAQMQERN